MVPARDAQGGRGRGAPICCGGPAAAQAAGPSITRVTEPPLRGASPPRPPPPPAHPALSVSSWVNSVSPPDLPLNPAPREVRTEPAPPGRPHRCRGSARARVGPAAARAHLRTRGPSGAPRLLQPRSSSVPGTLQASAREGRLRVSAPSYRRRQGGVRRS